MNRLNRTAKTMKHESL